MICFEKFGINDSVAAQIASPGGDAYVVIGSVLGGGMFDSARANVFWQDRRQSSSSANFSGRKPVASRCASADGDTGFGINTRVVTHLEACANALEATQYVASNDAAGCLSNRRRKCCSMPARNVDYVLTGMTAPVAVTTGGINLIAIVRPFVRGFLNECNPRCFTNYFAPPCGLPH